MHKVIITIETVLRDEYEVEVSDQEYEMLTKGDCQPIEDRGLFDATAGTLDIDTTYWVYDENKQKVVY